MKQWSMFPFFEWRETDFPLTGEYGSEGSTCGSAALAMIVNQKPCLLERQSGCGRSRPFDPVVMQKMLKRYKFESHLFEGPQGLVNLGRDAHWTSDELTYNHLLLFTADTTKQEASWFVTYAGGVYHNGALFSSSALFGLTHPAIDVLLVRRRKSRNGKRR
jgi:hypothetical protein